MNSKNKTNATKDAARPALVPKLRFPEFRGAEGWKFIPLNRLATRAKQKNRDEKIDRVLTNSAEFGVLDQRDFFDKDIATQGKLDGYFVVELGSYVYNPRISSTAPVGPISKNKIGTGVMSPLYTVFKFKDDRSEFYEQFFKTTGWHTYMRQASSTGARHDRMAISSDDFMAMPLPAPSPAEQQKIAECLSSIDQLIAAQARKVDALKTHKKGLMQQLFPREGETQPRLRFPKFQNAPAWDVKPLGKVAENLDNQRIPITSGNRKAGRIPYYGASGIVDYVDSFIFDEDLLCVSEDGANLVSRTYPIAFSISGKTWVNNHAHVLRFENACTQKFVEVYLNSIKLDDFITGMAQPKLNKTMLDRIPVPHPCVLEQEVIANCLHSLDARITAEAQKLEALKIHKKGLMQQLFPSPEEVDA
jgi:type I restriction enzyme, S subunit